MLAKIKSLWRQESGQDLPEYALLAALLVVALIVGIYAYSQANSNSFNGATDGLKAAAPGAGGGGGSAGGTGSSGDGGSSGATGGGAGTGDGGSGGSGGSGSGTGGSGGFGGGTGSGGGFGGHGNPLDPPGSGGESGR